MTEPEKALKRCPLCQKPIDLQMSFCKQDWSKLPASLRTPITLATEQKHFVAKVNAVKAAMDWFHEKRLHLIK